MAQADQPQDDPGNLQVALSELLNNHTYLNGVVDYCSSAYPANKLEVRDQAKKYTLGK
jgi:hypothetical protein